MEQLGPMMRSWLGLGSGQIAPSKNRLLKVKGMLKRIKQVIQVQKLVGLPPPTLELLGVFAEVITFSGASAHEF